MPFPPPITRRAALRNLGISLTLPWLESLFPHVQAGVNQASPAFPTRFAALLFPLGVNTKEWGASGAGKTMRLSSTLQPLVPYQSKIAVLEGVVHPHLKKLSNHAGKVGAYLTGEPAGRDGNPSGISIDQVLAREIGHQTEFPSLNLGISPARTGRAFYDSSISWRGPDQPATKEIDPRMTFELLFSDKSWLQQDRSVIDYILQQARDVHRKLSDLDRQTLTEYLDCLRDLELRIQRLDTRKQEWQADMQPRHQAQVFHPEETRQIPENDVPLLAPENFREHTRVMLDLLVLALRMDKTRIATFMFDSYGPRYQDFSFLPGVKGQWHSISHHQNAEPQLNAYATINRWHMSQFAYLLHEMDSIQEGERTLLDNSLLMISSDMWCGNVHSCPQYPLVLAGSAGGRLATGRHIKFEDGSMSRLFLSIADLMGAPLQQIREATESYHSELLT